MSPGLRRALSGMAGAAAMIAVITIISRLVGFARWFAQSNALGATPTGTAYATANTLPNIFFEVVAGGALAGAVVPLLAGPLAKHLRVDVNAISSALLTWALAVLVPTGVLLAVLARPLAGLLVDGVVGEDPAVTQATVDLASQLIVIFAPQVVLYGIGVVLSGILQAQRRFFWPAAAPLASSLVVIASYLAFRSIGGADRTDPAALSAQAVAWLGWGTTAGVAAMSLPLLIPVLRSGVRLRPTFRFPPGVALRARHLALAGIGGLLAQQAAALVTLKLANFSGGPGTFNIYQYSQAVYFLPYAVLAVPLATAAFPRLAEHAASGDLSRYSRLVAVSTRAVLLVSAAGAAALIAASPAITQMFVSNDANPNAAEALAPMSLTLAVLAPGLLGFGLIFQHSRVLFALERGRAAVTAVAIGWLAVVVASVVAVLALAPDRGDASGTLLGLAIGNTVGMTVAGIVLVIAVRRCAGAPSLAGTPRTLAVAVAGATVGAAVGRWVVDAVLGLLEDRFVTALFAGLGAAAVSVFLVLTATWFADRSTITGALTADRAVTTPGAPRFDSTEKPRD
ncbi:murein biosynthesis integral membrane protein MurJ [Pengzhenrongella frigida]|uniref:Virulence factor MviN n=1 Tax=Pengzhenrongella frigida TaxID=1259133 RepID=A0A4Q5MXT5_9MICO|nr:lipid II flippase MurJ [Cellulomonas sp. HLT2-17]RYV50562.1 virulence factor MviN [Cellulomonas sp. HLT2-17]